jgi:zinc protease
MLARFTITLLSAVLALVVVDSGCATTKEAVVEEVREAPREPWRQTRPAAGTPAPLAFPNFQKAELKNGLTLLLVEDHTLPTVHASLVVRAGASLDGKEAGLADLTWDLLDEGAGSYTASSLANAFADLGASIQTSAGREAGVVGVRVLKTRLEPALELLALVASRPTFGQPEFDRLKRQHQGALAEKEGSPETIAWQALVAEVYGADHAYGHPVDGTATSLDKVKLASVKRFWSDHAGPKNAALVLVGDLTLDDAKALAEKQLGKWRGGASKSKPPVTPKPKAATKILVVDFPGAPQTIIRLARPLMSATDAEQPAAIVMNQVLGGMFSSRLNLKLREEKQWTYGAYSNVDARVGAGPFHLGADVQSDKTGEALAEIFAQLDTMKTGGITDEELALGRDSYTRTLPALFALPELQAQAATSLFGLGLPVDHYATLNTAVAAVTADQVKAVAQRAIVKEDFVVVLVGDKAAIEAGLAGKNLGEVVFVGKDGTPAK